FLVLPLIQMGKKWGPIVTILLILGMIKVLFDMNQEMNSLGALLMINISRASGFIPGVVVGVLYKTRPKIWEYIERFFSKPFVGILTFCALLAIQWGDG